MFTFTIPAPGPARLPVTHFAAAAKAALTEIPDSATDEERAQAKAAVAAAAALVKAGHVGSEHVHVTVGVHANPGHAAPQSWLEQPSTIALTVRALPGPEAGG
jgi:hypothetical protein